MALLKRTADDLWRRFQNKFRHNPKRDSRIYLSLVCVFVALTALCLVPPLTASECDLEAPIGTKSPFDNPLSPKLTCMRRRRGWLLGLSELETDLGRRLLAALILGAIIGQERRAKDRPAGVKTNACVAVGACCFTICSTFAFESGSMSYDSSRSAAAIPSGVTFIGSAMVYKAIREKDSKKLKRSIGLLSAAAVWVSAAVGVATGGSLYWL
eukprot:CAMPEP_0198729486 /NCGR_PEP_ID=MMETSP1475-20131203/18823_1 /TAXON_ID= ORGANISM="Unidentified sp., Strain CCMP1999" /NCGR_SAMPLE_ID=MMETSP1475 /ASSEMBLY_ACC=CAM_ASM_001111 /LENGTH=211 /DNA_ID=CAMNT_0044492153 /DNA_START=169 /DNA_END=801 /DNA_ORIENTATION=-